MPWKPDRPGERPTLGPFVVEWIESNLARPDGADGLVTLTREQIDWCLRYYELDPERCTRRRRRGVLSRAKGWGRSPFLAMLAAAEAFAPVVPDGWDADGRPVGRPWSSLRRVWVQMLAVSEAQTRNSWVSLQEMMAEGPVSDVAGVDILETFVTLPNRGRIEFTTASAVSREGNRPVFAILDQTESWTARNRGVQLAATVRRNLAKVGGSSIESPNAYRPGSGSVSEASARYAADIAAGTVLDDGLLYDHRQGNVELEAGVTDAALIDALRVAYGDSSAHPDGCVLHDPPCPPGWVDLHRIVREIRDLDTAPEDAQQFYFNRPTSPPGSFLDADAVDALDKPATPLPERTR